MTHPNADMLSRFYTALAKRDPETMAACYAPDATFSDPVFTDLKGEEVPRMWRMLCGRAKDLTVTFDGIEADDTSGKANWVATYSFSGSGNKVVNRISSSFTFRAGKIASQKDHFDLYAWMKQALGLKGRLLGWLPPVQGKVRADAMGRLRGFKG